MVPTDDLPLGHGWPGPTATASPLAAPLACTRVLTPPRDWPGVQRWLFSDLFQQETVPSLCPRYTLILDVRLLSFISINPKTVTLTNALHTPKVSHKHCFTVKEISNTLLSPRSHGLPRNPLVDRLRAGRRKGVCSASRVFLINTYSGLIT